MRFTKFRIVITFFRASLLRFSKFWIIVITLFTVSIVMNPIPSLILFVPFNTISFN